MKTAILPALFVALSLAARAAIVVPGADGSDGVLNITVNTVIDLSQAPTGTWDQNNAANAGKGVYDPAKWAVVFKYSSVNVAPNVTVTFKNHASRAPVVWLVNGNVTIAGTVSLDGKDTTSVTPPMLTEPGPGGMRGGSSTLSVGVGPSAGFGIGGGNTLNSTRGASYGTLGTSGQPTYGNPSLIPLVGGSGGGSNGTGASGGQAGGAGGGAIMIACSQELSINGVISANGGSGNHGFGNGFEYTGGGSGGGIRLISNSLAGSGRVTALGGNSPSYGGLGRIRIERVDNSSSYSVISPDPSVVPLTSDVTALLWPPAGAPDVRIVSIGGMNTPLDPRASFGSAGADVALPQTTTSQALIETTNVEQSAIVKVRVTPRTNADFTMVTATFDSIVSANPLVIRWVATLPVNTGYSAVQAHVVRP